MNHDATHHPNSNGIDAFLSEAPLSSHSAPQAVPVRRSQRSFGFGRAAAVISYALVGMVLAVVFVLRSTTTIEPPSTSPIAEPVEPRSDATPLPPPPVEPEVNRAPPAPEPRAIVPPPSAPAVTPQPAPAAPPAPAPRAIEKPPSPRAIERPIERPPAPSRAAVDRPSPVPPPVRPAPVEPAPAPVRPPVAVADEPALVTPPAPTPVPERTTAPERAPAVAAAPPAPAAAPPASAAAPSSAPAPAPAPAASIAAREVTGVETALTRYRRAFTALDANAAARVWPTVNQKDLSRAFDRLEEQELAFDGCDIDVAASRAEATCKGTARYVPRVGARTARVDQRQWRFSLVKVRDEWLIGAVDVR